MKLVLLLSLALAVGARAEDLTLENIHLNGTFNTKVPSKPQWMPGGKHLLLRETDAAGLPQLSLWDLGAVTNVIATANDLKLNPADADPVKFSHIIAANNGSFLILTETLNSRAVKTGGHVYRYVIATKKLEELAAAVTDKQIIQLAPDDNKLGFVSKNDLFVLDLKTGALKQLTFTGSTTMLNGVFDWVYEEEFGIINGWTWSPTAEHIAFWQIDQSAVPEFPLLNYASAHPTIEWMRYPKAGDPNPTAKIGIVSVNLGTTQWVDVAQTGEFYLPRASWVSRDTLAVQVLNRPQNKLELRLQVLGKPTTELAFTETQTTWIDVTDDLRRIPGRPFVLWTSEESGWNHLYMVDQTTRKAITQDKAWEITEVNGTDGKFAYFLGTRAGVNETQLYSVDLDTLKILRLSKESGTHSVNWSPAYTHYLDTFQNNSTPPSLRLYKRDGTLVKTFTEVPPAFQGLKLATTEFVGIKIPSGGKINGKIMKPADFDPAKKYPVLLSPYGGPGSRKSHDKWDGLWPQYLASRGIVTVTVDNRGTGGRGKAFKSQTYLNLGIMESDDQIEVAKYLGTLPWVDAAKIGMWGWSYGGFLTAMTVERGGSLFAAGIAVAPVSHWKYYDSIYTERFMSTPALNPVGYEKGSPLSHTGSLTAPLLVVHGTGDDNVHYQNSVTLADELLAKNKWVETIVYPYRSHSLTEGQYTQYHLYRRLSEFLLRHLKGELSWGAPNPLDELVLPRPLP